MLAHPLAGRLLAAALVATVALAARAADSAPPAPAPEKPGDRDLAAARKAIEAKAWADAVRLLEKARARQEGNADVHNLLGYAERNQGHLEAAFAHYERALKLDPDHRGAHEYLGVAYLQAGELPKAEAQLAALARLCGSSCEEYRDLAAEIADYKRARAASTR